jgi:hypothetical protein
MSQFNSATWRLYAAALHHDTEARLWLIREIGPDPGAWCQIATELAEMLADEVMQQLHDSDFARTGVTADEIYSDVAHEIGAAMRRESAA